MIDYRNKAIHCVKDTILPMQRKQFEECGCCLDQQYKRYGNTEWLLAKTIRGAKLDSLADLIMYTVVIIMLCLWDF